MVLLIVGSLVTAIGVTGCSSAGGSSGTTAAVPQTYTITVTATSAGQSQSTNVTLIVQ
jgi:ABC-type glycerol-3-phosphate transport system substrate-binding protein